MTSTPIPPRKQAPGTVAVWMTAAVFLVLASATSGLTSAPAAEWTYYDVPLTSLLLDDGGVLPVEAPGRYASQVENGGVLATALTGARIDGGEGYLWTELPARLPGMTVEPLRTSLRLRAPTGQLVRGVLFLTEGRDRRPSEWSLRRFPFHLGPDAPESTEREFLTARRAHLARLEVLELPGQPWFQAARADLDRLLGASPPVAEARPVGLFESDLDTTFELFTGRRALRETLQVERMRDVEGHGTGEPIPVDQVPGIQVPAIEWAPLLKGKEPVVEPLARWVPDDQLLVSFSSFVALADLVDELEQRGPALVQFLEDRGQDARTRERLEQQLCLELTHLARWLGPRMVRSVAITCSDPYLREGTDVTILMETVVPAPVLGMVQAQRVERTGGQEDVDTWNGAIAGAEVSGCQTPDRRVSSFSAAVGDVVVVSNSLLALERILRARQGEHPSHGNSEEYRFFRDRYVFEAGSPSVLFFLSDAFLRRFCGPAWRVAESRRLFCAHSMEQAVARHLLAGGPVDEPGPALRCPSGGTLVRGDGFGVLCTVHGTTGFLTPIAETPVEQLTPQELRAYQRFRNRYQSFWRQFFDPVAIQVRTGEALEVDLTVMPLIEGTDYDELRTLSGGEGTLTARHGDPHDDALLHWIVHVNKDAPEVREMASMMASLPGMEKGPLRWMGDSLEVFVDRDAVLDTLATAEDLDDWFDENLARLPIALRIPVRDPVHFGMFLVALRAFTDGSTGGLLAWETRRHGEAPYVVIRAADQRSEDLFADELENLQICYAATGGAFYLTLSEDLLKRAMDRSAARLESGEPPTHEWLGDHTSMRVHLQDAMLMLQALLSPYQDRALADCTRNFPALLEWRRLFPGEDPIDAHERLWKVRVRCPLGGRYTFDEALGWPVCSEHGHPEEPRTSRALPAALHGVGHVEAGLTFEEQGLRVRFSARRE